MDDLKRFNFLISNTENKNIVMSRDEVIEYVFAFANTREARKTDISLLMDAKITLKSMRYNMIKAEHKLNNKPRLDAQRYIGKKEVREYIFNLYGKICLCCGGDSKIALDHIIPVILDGKNELGNLQPLCNRCNSKKGTKVIDYRI